MTHCFNYLTGCIDVIDWQISI